MPDGSTGAVRFTFAGAATLALRRAGAERPVVALAGAVIVLALVVVTAAPLAVAALTDAGLQRRLVDAPTGSGTEVTLRVDPSQQLTTAAAVEAAVGEHLGAYTSAPWTTAVGPTFDVAAEGEAAETTLVTAPWVSGHADLVSGSWPDDPVGPVIPAAVHADGAARLGLDVGDTLVATREGTTDVTLTIVAAYRPTDVDAAVWWDDPLLRDGGGADDAEVASIGPLVVTPAGLTASGATNVTLRTRALVEPEAVDLSRRGAIAGAIEDLRGDLADRVGASPTAVATDLPQLLAAAASEVTTTRSAVLMTILQLVVVAVLTLSLAAGLLVGRRTVETALVRSRGGSTRQLVAASLVEGLALTVPAVLAAPWLAAAAVSVLGRVGPLGALGVPLEPRVTPGTYLVAAAGGLLCLVILVAPVARSAGTFASARAGRGRSTGVTSLRRYGLDVVAVALALVGIWQLRRYDGALAGTASGTIGVDPLLVIAPTLALLAGSLLLLRLVPRLGRTAERLPARARSLVPAVTTWHLGRRPTQVARGLLLLVLSVAVVTLSGAYADTWDAARADRAAAAVGADVSVRPDQRPSAPVPSHLIGGAIAELPGVSGRTPVTTAHTSMPRGRGVVQFAAVDTRADVVRFRDDQGPGEVPLDDLHAPRAVPSVALPDGVELTAEVVATVRGRAAEGTAQEPHGEVGFALTVRDGDGLIQRLATSRVPADGARHPVASTLVDERGGRAASVTGPVELLAVELSFAHGRGEPAQRTVDVEVTRLNVDGRPGVLADVTWAATVDSGGPDESASASEPQGSDDGLAVTLRAATGEGVAPTHLRLAVEGEPSAPEPLPALATPGLLAATELQVGDVLELRTPGVAVQARLVDTIGYLPGDPGADAGLLLDLPTLAAHRYLEAGVATSPDAWWLATTDGEAVRVVDGLRAAPFQAQEVVAASELRDRSLVDPLGIGLSGVLALALAVAGAAAVVGYGAAAAATAGEQVPDVAALRGLGLTRHQLRRWSLAETATVVGAATVGGIAVGLAVARAILPSIAVARDGTPPVPTPQVIVPWSTISVTVVAATLVVLVVALTVARAARRVPVAATLRAGGDA